MAIAKVAVATCNFLRQVVPTEVMCSIPEVLAMSVAQVMEFQVDQGSMGVVSR